MAAYKKACRKGDEKCTQVIQRLVVKKWSCPHVSRWGWLDGDAWIFILVWPGQDSHAALAQGWVHEHEPLQTEIRHIWYGLMAAWRPTLSIFINEKKSLRVCLRIRKKVCHIVTKVTASIMCLTYGKSSICTSTHSFPPWVFPSRVVGAGGTGAYTSSIWMKAGNHPEWVAGFNWALTEGLVLGSKVPWLWRCPTPLPTHLPTFGYNQVFPAQSPTNWTTVYCIWPFIYCV